MIDEERTPLKVPRLERGHLQIEAAAALAPGEYWDFSAAGEAVDKGSAKKE